MTDEQKSPVPAVDAVPSEVVENPVAVLNADLSNSEKLRLLEKAELHAQQMMDAAGEGMTGDDLPTLDELSELIEKVKTGQSQVHLPAWFEISSMAIRWGERLGLSAMGSSHIPSDKKRQADSAQRKSGAGDENRTHDMQLGKLPFYH